MDKLTFLDQITDLALQGQSRAAPPLMQGMKPVEVIDSLYEEPDSNRAMRRYVHKLFRNEGDIRARAALRQLERKTGAAKAPSRRAGRL